MSDIREALLALLGRPDHAPMSTHDPRDGSCQSCPWPLHEMPPEDIADAWARLLGHEAPVALAGETIRTSLESSLAALVANGWGGGERDRH